MGLVNIAWPEFRQLYLELVGGTGQLPTAAVQCSEASWKCQIKLKKKWYNLTLISQLF